MSAVVEQIEDAINENPFPSESERPAYVVLDNWEERNSRKYKPGVYYCSVEAAKKDQPAKSQEIWICSPVYVDAITRDTQNNNFGRLLRFIPTVGDWREWSMPMDLLSGSGDELRGRLLNMGVEICPKNGRNHLHNYLSSQYPKRNAICATQVGWHGESFVLPDTVIGPDGTDVIFQSGEVDHDEYTCSGSLDSWKSNLTMLALDNPLLAFALSAAFAGPLLSKCHSEGGGVHFVGESSTGKTTLIEAACSVWGGPNYKRSWRATANGMEGAAVLFNDNLLALDEVSECDPREVGAIIYALGNGRGKQRANRSGAGRSVVRWRCFILSSGERTIATTMLEGGSHTKAGQSVRMLDIPTDRTYGAWDDLHGYKNGAALSDAIKTTASQHYGFAGREFLKALINDKRDLPAYLAKFRELALFNSGGEGQHKRVAARIALVAMAGELATQYGITGWPEGLATKSAAECFSLWLEDRPQGNDERRQIAQAFSDFIQRHGDSRFSSIEPEDNIQIRDRAGWWKTVDKKRLYLFNAAGMREALKGIDFKYGLDVLQEIGALEPSGANGERAKPIRVQGNTVKVYSINPSRLEGYS